MLRPLLRQPLHCSVSPRTVGIRSYHSIRYAPPSPPYNRAETSILAAALLHVPTHGFTTTSLTHGARDTGYLDISPTIFPRGAFNLVQYHLDTQRRALETSVTLTPDMSIPRKIRALCVARLRGNEPVIGRLGEALAIMSLMENIPASTKELGALSDEMWGIAGDKSVDTSWYTKRAMLAGVYASTELFMTQDRSKDFRDTWEFLDRRLDDVKTVGMTTKNVGEYVGFTLAAAANVLRSKNVPFF